MFELKALMMLHAAAARTRPLFEYLDTDMILLYHTSTLMPFKYQICKP